MKLSFLISSLLLHTLVLAGPLYVGKNSTEVKVKFNAFLDTKTGLSKSQILNQLYSNVKYLTGPMKLAKYPAGIRGGYKISIKRITSPKRGVQRVHYELSGIMVLKKKAPKDYIFYVLNNPQEAMVKGAECSYKPSEPWWYNWVPWIANCNLKEGEDYQLVKMKVERIPNTKISYPEYDRLVDGKRNLRVDVFFGMASYSLFPWDPDKVQDASAPEYRKLRAHLLSLGFEGGKWSEREIETIYKPRDKKYPYVEEYRLKGSQANMKVRLFYADTGFNYSSNAFHAFYKDSLENASVMMYGGHSGLGSNINISSIESKRRFRIKAPSKYQLFLIESCLPYSYYTQMFHDWKKVRFDQYGTKNLDVIATGGDVTYFNRIGGDFKKMISYLYRYSVDAKWTSYQEITDDINFSRALFGVSGDEDNPKQPRS